MFNVNKNARELETVDYVQGQSTGWKRNMFNVNKNARELK